MPLPRKTTAECPNCQTVFTNVPMGTDEDGLYAALELTACSVCTALLCPCCDKFACDGCGQTFCSSHRLTWDEEPECNCRFAGDSADARDCGLHNPDVRSAPLDLCPGCHAEMRQAELPELEQLGNVRKPAHGLTVVVGKISKQVA